MLCSVYLSWPFPTTNNTKLNCLYMYMCIIRQVEFIQSYINCIPLFPFVSSVFQFVLVFSHSLFLLSTTLHTQMYNNYMY